MSKNREMMEPFIKVGLGVALVVASVAGYGSLMVHVLFILLLFPVLIGMAIEGWERNNIAFKETNSASLIMYIHGIPVREEVHYLKNVHFRDKEVLIKKLLLIVKVKTILVAANCLLALVNFYRIVFYYEHGEYYSLQLCIGIAVISFVFYKLKESIYLQRMCVTNQWHIESALIKNTLLHSAYFTQQDTERVIYRPFFGFFFR